MKFPMTLQGGLMTYALSFPDALPPVLSTQWRKTKVVVDKDILAWSQPACIL